MPRKKQKQNTTSAPGWLPRVFEGVFGKSVPQKSGNRQSTSNRNHTPVIAPQLSIMRGRLEDVLRHQLIAPEAYRARSELIRSTVLLHSRAMSGENFVATSVADLRMMSELYDSMYFDSSCIALAKHYGMAFRWSGRMTRAGGKTTRTVRRGTTKRPAEINYEITLSSSLLFQTFQDDQRPIKVCGQLCSNRLEAMQRIVEHEAIHLAEMLVWINSDCAAGRFQAITNRLFGHTEHRHELVTQRERAAKVYDIRVGSRVYFIHEGKPVEGVVNRITRRATVLVESSSGEIYNNNKRYLKYYVPIAGLTAK